LTNTGITLPEEMEMGNSQMRSRLSTNKLFGLTAAILLLCTINLSAQYHDFNSWWKLELSKEITKELDATLDLSQRFDQNSLRYDRSLATLGLQYRIHENIDVEAAYRYYLVNQFGGGLDSRYRIHGSVILSKRFDDFKISLRERLNYGFDDLTQTNTYYGNRLMNRGRLKVSYDIFGTPISVYSFYEMWLDVSRLNATHMLAHRFRGGLLYDINFRSKINLSYLHKIEVNQINPITSHILYLAYSYQF